MIKTDTWPVFRAPSEPWVFGEGSGLWRLPCTSQSLPGFLTKVEVTPLVLGLEEAPPGLSVDVGSLGHEELHVVFAAALDGNVQGGLTWREWRDSHQGSGGAETRPVLEEVGAECGNRVGAAG